VLHEAGNNAHAEGGGRTGGQLVRDNNPCFGMCFRPFDAGRKIFLGKDASWHGVCILLLQMGSGVLIFLWWTDRELWTTHFTWEHGYVRAQSHNKKQEERQ